MKRDLALWTSILTGPVAWFLSMQANFALAPLACENNWKPALYFVSLGGLILSAAAGFTGWSQWQQLGRGDELARSRAMAMAGIVLSAAFCLTIIAQAIPEIMLAGCE